MAGLSLEDDEFTSGEYSVFIINERKIHTARIILTNVINLIVYLF